MLAWGPFRPDAAGPNTGFCTVADNVMPEAAAGGLGYTPFPQLATASGAVALAGAPLGSITLQRGDGTWQVYFASSAKIQVLTSAYGWTDIDTGRTVTSGDDVSFAAFGAFLLNTDTTDGFKAYNFETPAGNNTVSAAPTARQIFVCNNVVFALSCGGNTKRMQSSAVGDHTNWTTQGADGKTFEDGGPLVGGRDLKNGTAVIFQETAMRLIQFTGGGSALYSIQKIAEGRGAVADRSIVAFDGMVFWLATDGFYKYVPGGQPQPIGSEKINHWFADLVSTADFEAVQGAVDPANRIVLWRLSATRLLGYDWVLNEWFTVTAATTALTQIATAAATIDSVTSSIDSNEIAIDSRVWQGGQPVFGALDASYKFATFSGSNAAATLQSAIVSTAGSKRFIWATPVSDAPNSTLQVGVSDKLSSSLTWDTAATRNDNGEVPLDTRGNNFAFIEAIPAGETWTFATGVDNIVMAADGQR